MFGNVVVGCACAGDQETSYWAHMVTKAAVKDEFVADITLFFHLDLNTWWSEPPQETTFHECSKCDIVQVQDYRVVFM